MKGLAVMVLIGLVIGVIVLAVVSLIFLSGLQYSPLDARRTFTEGCALYCSDITETAAATDQPIGIAAVEKGHELDGSLFVRACNMLYPETVGYPYLCWIRDCCTFALPKR